MFNLILKMEQADIIEPFDIFLQNVCSKSLNVFKYLEL